MTPVRVKSIVIAIIILLIILSGFITFFFRTQQSEGVSQFTVECTNGGSVQIVENISLGEYNFTTSETNDSFRFLLSFQMSYERMYDHQNISFRIEPRYSLGNGHYTVSESVGVEIIEQGVMQSWVTGHDNLPGLVMMQYSLKNFTYSYNTERENTQQFHISWAFNLTSESVPKDDFVCDLIVELRVNEFSEGISNTEAITVISAIWIAGVVFLFELNRRRG